MDIPERTPETIFKIDSGEKVLKHQSIKIVPNTVVVAYYRGVVTALAAVDTVLYLHALGGRYETRSVRPHKVEHIVVNGVNQRCAITVRAGTKFCGPIWCAPKRRDALLATLPNLAIKGGGRWCTPVDKYGDFECAACGKIFKTDRELFEHGKVPAVQHERFTNPYYLIPQTWTPIPPAVKVAPVSHTNYAEGTLHDQKHASSYNRTTYGQHRTNALKQRLGRLQRRHGNRYVPYVVRQVYK